MTTEVIKEDMEVTETQEKLSVSIVITGKAEVKELQKSLSNKNNTVAFVPIEDDHLNESNSFNFKTMQPAIDYAQQNNYDLVIGADTKSNKISVAVRKTINDPFQLLNSHQLAVLMASWYIKSHQSEDLIFVKSSQITQMLENISWKERIECLDKIVVPGSLPSIINEISEQRGNIRIVGFTENQEIYDNQEDFETLVERIVEMAKSLKDENKTIYDNLIEIYKNHGFFKEKKFIVKYTNAVHHDQILKKMDLIRKNPDLVRDRLKAIKLTDYKKGFSKNLISKNTIQTDQSGFNILKLEMEDGISVTLAPAEDKMYYYIGIKESLRALEDLNEINRNFDEHAVRLMQTINKL